MAILALVGLTVDRLGGAKKRRSPNDPGEPAQGDEG